MQKTDTAIKINKYQQIFFSHNFLQQRNRIKIQVEEFFVKGT